MRLRGLDELHRQEAIMNKSFEDDGVLARLHCHLVEVDDRSQKWLILLGHTLLVDVELSGSILIDCQEVKSLLSCRPGWNLVDGFLDLVVSLVCQKTERGRVGKGDSKAPMGHCEVINSWS